MKIYSDVIIYEILKLNFYLTNSSIICISSLKNAFYEILDIIEVNDNVSLSFNFEKELKKFLDLYDEFVTHNGETLSLDAPLTNLLTQIIKSHHNKISSLNYKVSDYVLNPKICHTLGLSIPFETSKKYLFLNSLILQRYLKIGEKEFHHTPISKEDFEALEDTLIKFYALFNDIENSDLIKLRICFNTFNAEFLSHKNEVFINSPWNTILFSYNPTRYQSLRYDKTEHLTNIIEERLEDEQEELLDSFLADIDPNEKLEDLSLFLTYFFHYLTKYLKNNPDCIAREALIIKKYLLLSTPELNHLERYFIKNHTLEGFELPTISDYDITDTSFEELKDKVMECTINLNITDKDALKYHHLYAKIITCVLFIKTYLTLSINENSKKDIIDLLTNSISYKNPDYKMSSSIIDSIIFSDGFNLKK